LLLLVLSLALFFVAVLFFFVTSSAPLIFTLPGLVSKTRRVFCCA
jgi:hypothetical protein